jgi:mRNA interferase RelE/StbE
MFEISYSKTAERFFKKINDKHLLSTFKTAIDKLKHDPYVGTQKIGDLRGIYGCDLKYNNVNYELAYRIYEGNNPCVVIVLAGTRENFYEELKRLIKD